jgi:hypothetical protein
MTKLTATATCSERGHVALSAFSTKPLWGDCTYQRLVGEQWLHSGFTSHHSYPKSVKLKDDQVVCGSAAAGNYRPILWLGEGSAGCGDFDVEVWTWWVME